MNYFFVTLLIILLAITANSQNEKLFYVFNVSPDVKVTKQNYIIDSDGNLLGYGMDIKNISSKTIITVTWVFEGEVEYCGRKQFIKVNGGTIKTRLLPKEEKQFEIPPKPDENRNFRLSITRIEFADSNVWERPKEEKQENLP